MTTDTGRGDETESTEREPIYLRKRGIQRRMRCKGGTAVRIENAFVTVGQMMDAIESEDDLTDVDGIGPKTAEVIEEWYEHRHVQEEKMPESTVERSSSKAATIHFHKSWEELL